MLQTWHLWLCEANYQAVATLEDIPPRPHVLAYQAPATSLTEGGPVILPAHGRTISCACELAVELGQKVYRADASTAQTAIRGYRVLIGFRDSALIEEVPLPTARDHGVCVYYARWADTFNCVSPLIEAAEVQNPYDARMDLALDGHAPVVTHTGDYLHQAPAAIVALSRATTLQPGDIISLGRAGEMVTVPADQHLPEGTKASAKIKDIGQLTTQIQDHRTLKPPT
jgi:2-keto-4-pentenoate hydratase/2-oxohepta-3-ene-1,7-dioic acid hydratase in catechol pathway